ncbi:hypothetical protein EO244_09580 [Ancylomarina salipaludis]|uniref:NlpC/P60 domain-containing protein n=1 Tax=Ancylomarina salipaludis TaxID=2501299 RepID=A0A4Q1JLR0_9BACT|nr:NlpC/P60 family protein [Ancylomarina salipaludis]RXQ94522.1 hypothetical protein EO244_09580 [Ancylomarina salipaludis]
MFRKILLLIIITLIVTSCSINKHASRQAAKQLVSNKNTSINLVEQDTCKPAIKQDTNKYISKPDTNRLVNKHLEWQAGIKNKLENEYLKYRGVPYKYGGTSIKGFDCSAFVQLTYKKALNINLPRSTRQMLKVGIVVAKNKLEIGDLLFFKPTSNYQHVGIYIGKDQFMHVSTKRGVTKSNLNTTYWKKCYFTSRRLLQTNAGS